MKTLKISLLIIAAAVVGFLIYKIIDPPPPPPPQPLPPITNVFIETIKSSITELEEQPSTDFSKNKYDKIMYLIDDYHKNGKLGDDQTYNDRQQELLKRNLYTAYSKVFPKQALQVFNGSEWNQSDLDFIRRETRELKKSPFLERGSPADKEFDKINNILSAYDKANAFIAQAGRFSYNSTSLNDDFPINQAAKIISDVNAYKSSGMGNSYLKNCKRMQNEFDGIKGKVYRAHVRYLDNLINSWSDMYTSYNSQRTFVQTLYNPIKEKIDKLDNSIYTGMNVNADINRLKNKWMDVSTNAYMYFNQ